MAIKDTNTYACKIQTIISKNIIAIITTKSTAPKKTLAKSIAENKFQQTEISILINICPESILANSLIAKLNTLIMYEITSINIRNGAIKPGTPEGKNPAKKVNPCSLAPIITTPPKKVSDKKNGRISMLVTVYAKGTIPIKFETKINTNK
jgi:hypothetical protein